MFFRDYFRLWADVPAVFLWRCFAVCRWCNLVDSTRMLASVVISSVLTIRRTNFKQRRTLPGWTERWAVSGEECFSKRRATDVEFMHPFLIRSCRSVSGDSAGLADWFKSSADRFTFVGLGGTRALTVLSGRLARPSRPDFHLLKQLRASACNLSS